MKQQYNCNLYVPKVETQNIYRRPKSNYTEMKHRPKQWFKKKKSKNSINKLQDHFTDVLMYTKLESLKNKGMKGIENMLKEIQKEKIQI